MKIHVLVALVLCWSLLPEGSAFRSAPEDKETAQNDEYRKKVEKLEEDYLKGLASLATQARKGQWDSEAARLARKALRQRPDFSEAKELLEQIKAKPSRSSSTQPTPALRRQLDNGYRQLTQKTIGGYLALATWCDKNRLTEEKGKCLAAGLAIDPEHKGLRNAAGHKLHPEFGWVDKEADAKLRAGQRRWRGEWKPWPAIQKERLAEFQKEMSASLGPAFRYTVTPRLNIASSLQDRAFEKQITEDVELLIRDQCRTFYGDMPLEMTPFTCVLFNQRGDFQEFVKKTNRPELAGGMGFYDSADRCLYIWHVANSGDGFAFNGIGTTFHEMTHGMIKDFMAGRSPPTWLDEGYASFFEMARPSNGQFQFGPVNVRRMRTLRAALDQKRPLDLEGLLSLTDRVRFHDRDDIFNYNRAAMLMHFLFDQGKLREFLQEAKENSDGTELLTTVMGDSLKNNEQQLTAYAIQKLR